MKIMVIGCNNDREAIQTVRHVAALGTNQGVVIVPGDIIEDIPKDTRLMEYKRIPDIALIDLEKPMSMRKLDSQPWSKEFKNKNKFKKR